MHASRISVDRWYTVAPHHPLVQAAAATQECVRRPYGPLLTSSSSPPPPLLPATSIRNPFPPQPTRTLIHIQTHFFIPRLSPPNSSNDGDGSEGNDPYSFSSGIDIEIEKFGGNNNRRRIRAKIGVEASLQTVWNILTDYEGLADFIPGLAVSQLLEKRHNFARLFQIGQQNLAFGLKFNAKGIVECYEKDPEILPSGQRRDIEFKMIEGDFQLFQGKWSIEQFSTRICEQSDSLFSQEFDTTTLTYIVDVEPKLWLPVRLVEGRLCREIKMNLSCIQQKAQESYHNTLPVY